MTDYAAPLADMRFALNELAGLKDIAGLPGYEEATPDLVDAVLEEANKLASEVIAPLNHSGDKEKAVYENGAVRTPKGFAEAYGQFVEGGWNALPFDPDYGGQGLPWTLGSALAEMWNSANMAFALCPLLTQGAVELLQAHGSEEQKDSYLPRLISGEWTGTMNLTEPQAGTDVGAVKTRAKPNGDHYLITGQKIYITYGEHDFTDNIIHMVLARTPGAPAGSKGISLFIVPKFLPKEDGTPGTRNDLRCVSIEYMFTMMNNARLTVGLQGVAIAERAYQQALHYARDRVQSAEVGSRGDAVAIIRHPDVRRMLMTMKSQTEAARALAYVAAGEMDRARRDPDEAARQSHQIDGIDLLTPIVKAWSTDLGVEIASLGVQVHGGMGFIEETGAAQHLRDARITPIYEGTNGVQALDLVGRKILRYKGETAQRVIARMEEELQGLTASTRVKMIASAVGAGVENLKQATGWLVEAGGKDMKLAAAASSPYLRLFGTVAGGWQMARAAERAETLLAEGEGDTAFLEAKIKSALFYADNVLPQAIGLMTAATRGAETLQMIEDADF